MNENILDALRACIQLGDKEVTMTAVGRFDFAAAQFIRQHGPTLEQSLRSLADENQALLRERDALHAALTGILAIVADSRGVDGYHLNGVIAEWDDFPEIAEAEAAITLAGLKP